MCHVLDTTSGRRVDLDDLQADQIDIKDIAGALSRICRFGAQTREFYSVAQHAVYVSQLVEEHGRPDLALAALHHDSHEAYACDLPSPVKKWIRRAGCSKGKYDALCDALDVAILASLEISEPERADALLIKRADSVALIKEARTLLYDGGKRVTVPPRELPPWASSAPPLGELLAPDEAGSAFLGWHELLTA